MMESSSPALLLSFDDDVGIITHCSKQKADSVLQYNNTALASSRAADGDQPGRCRLNF